MYISILKEIGNGSWVVSVGSKYNSYLFLVVILFSVLIVPMFDASVYVLNLVYVVTLLP
jgi:hypothetical protein